MGRFITLLLGALIVGGLAYYTLKGANPLSSKADVEAQQGLQNVRKEAKRIEDDAQRRAEESVKKAEPVEVGQPAE
jgi:F0F1-type ATP synthase membrane subunit b/b'